jgi:hypothetical protein
LDGGIAKVGCKVVEWFRNACNQNQRWISGLSVGLVALEEIPQPSCNNFLDLAIGIVARGGAAIFTENSSSFRETLRQVVGLETKEPTLGYGQACRQPGLHMMETPTANLVETITGLCATGVDLVLVFSDKVLVPGNPLVPVVQVSSPAVREMPWAEDVDVIIEGEITRTAEQLWSAASAVCSGKLTRSQALGNVAFQITRGNFGISL